MPLCMPNRINLTPGAKPVRNSGLVITRDGDKTVLRFPNEASGFGMNESAALVWQLCDGTRSFSEICNEIVKVSKGEVDSVESDVSAIVSSLISHGLIEFNKPAPKPILRIAFIGSPEHFNIADNFFLNMFVNWFDLLVIDPTEDPELLISWSASEARGVLDDVVVQCLVDEEGHQSAEMYDLVFQPAKCQTEADTITLKLPQDYLQNPVQPLNETDRTSLNSMFRREAPDKNMPVVEQPLRKKLTIGMATYDDYDGVYFTVQAIRMFHPEVTDETEILVIDNNPSGPCAESLKSLESVIPGYRYLAVDEVQGTAVRDFIFREANTEYVMCIDSHVFIEAGGICKLIDYFEHHPDTPDLLQGPMLGDDLKSYSTHFEPAWRQGMFGVWSKDERGHELEEEPFEIPMQGMGLAACRKSAWPGYNPLFHGFCVEEGYIHEKFRQSGGRTLCLPFLRWLHRFARPMGTRYENKWEDRIRNYLIAFDEVGEYGAGAIDHFSQLLSPEVVQQVVEQYQKEKQKDGTTQTGS